MALDFRKMKTKAERSRIGVTFDYIDGTEKEGDPITRVKIARPGRQFQTFVQAKLAGVKRSRRGADIEDALLDPQMEPVYREAYAKLVILDWENVLGENGEPVTYDVKLGMEALLDPEFFAWVRAKSSDVEAFRDEDLEADAGN